MNTCIGYLYRYRGTVLYLYDTWVEYCTRTDAGTQFQYWLSVTILGLSTLLVPIKYGKDPRVERSARTDHVLVLILGLSTLLIQLKSVIGAFLLFPYASTGMWSPLGQSTIRPGGLWTGGSRVVCGGTAPVFLLLYVFCFLNLGGCWCAFRLPPFALWPLVVLPSCWWWPCSSHGRSCTSRQCWGGQGRCRRWPRLPERPAPGGRTRGCQRWPRRWPSMMAWRRYAPGRRPPPWPRRSPPPGGASGDTWVPPGTTWPEGVGGKQLNELVHFVFIRYVYDY